MKVAVTGGAGFIGSHVVDRLVDAGHDVVVLDRVRPHRDDVGHVDVDMADLEALVAATEGMDAVFHLAAYADVNDVAADPVGAVEANVTNTTRVWEACRRNGVRRAILASTVWVYGSAAEAPGPLEEDAQFVLEPASHLYTASKLSAEMVAHSYAMLYGQEFTILRYGIPYGPRMRPALVLPKFVGMALEDKPITIQGDGSQHRNYVYVEDLAEAHVLALGDAGVNETFNLEGSEQVSMRYLVECIGDALGHPLEVTYVEARAGDYAGREVSAAKAADVLGWRPTVPFAEGVQRFVDWRLALDSEPAPAPAPVVAAAAPAVETAVTTTNGRVGSVLAGVGVAPLAVSALVAAGSSPFATRLVGVLGTVAAAIVAVAVARRGVRLAPTVALPLAVASVWLTSQVNPGFGPAALAVILAITVVAALRDRPQAGVVAAAVAALVGVRVVEPHLLPWAAGGMAFVALAGSIAMAGWAERRRGSWRVSVGLVTASVLVGSWAGASSAEAAWFGPVVEHGPRHGHAVAITFDGIPRSKALSTILSTLDDGGARATFFPAASDVVAHPDETRIVLAGGHQLGLGYPDGVVNTFAARPVGIGRQQAADRGAVGVCPSVLRPSHGRHTPVLSSAAHHRRMRVVTWDVALGKAGDDAAAAHDVVAKVRPGSIINLRLDNDDAVAEARMANRLALILQGLHDRHLTAVRLDRLLGAAPYTADC